MAEPIRSSSAGATPASGSPPTGKVRIYDRPARPWLTWKLILAVVFFLILLLAFAYYALYR